MYAGKIEVFLKVYVNERGYLITLSDIKLSFLPIQISLELATNFSHFRIHHFHLLADS